MQPAIQQVIRALAEDGRAGAINIAEHAVDSYLAGAPSEGDRALSRDILVRDLASLRGVAPHLAAFIGRVESYVAGLAQPSLEPGGLKAAHRLAVVTGDVTPPRETQATASWLSRLMNT
ncbi:hypothetical protein ACU4GA_07760 [Methylobacterium oryzae CBMB20]